MKTKVKRELCVGCKNEVGDADCFTDYHILPRVTCSRIGCAELWFCPDCYAGHVYAVHGLTTPPPVQS